MLDPHAEGMANACEASVPGRACVALLRAATRGRSMLRPYTPPHACLLPRKRSFPVRYKSPTDNSRAPGDANDRAS